MFIKDQGGGRLTSGWGVIISSCTLTLPRRPGPDALAPAPRPVGPPHDPGLLLPQPLSSVAPGQRDAGGGPDARAGRPRPQRLDPTAAALAGARQLGTHEEIPESLPGRVRGPGAGGAPGAGRDL